MDSTTEREHHAPVVGHLSSFAAVGVDVILNTHARLVLFGFAPAMLALCLFFLHTGPWKPLAHVQHVSPQPV